jgi:hypothetical protein
MSSTSSSVNPLMHPGRMSSSVVPGWPATDRHSASSSDRWAARDGTGWPSPSLWVGACEVEKPRAPSAMHLPARSTRADTWASVASAPTASSPMTARRRVEWPTRKPALTPTAPSNRASHSPKDRHDQSRDASEASGIPSTRAIIRAR